MTLLAVLVALFKDSYLRWRNHPLLRASIASRPPDCAENEATAFNARSGEVLAHARCYYLRVWVENIGRGRADKVQVYAAALFKLDPDSQQFRGVEGFLPMNLLWAHSQPGHPTVFAEGISPGMGQHCDLGHIVSPEQSEPFGATRQNAVLGETTLALDLEAPPATRNHLLAPGTYRLELRIAGANAARITRIVRIHLSGRWYDDAQQMFAEGITVSMKE
jgi:hypothetical protein